MGCLLPGHCQSDLMSTQRGVGMGLGQTGIWEEEWAPVLGKPRLREAKAIVQQIVHQELEPSAGEKLSDGASLESHN